MNKPNIVVIGSLNMDLVHSMERMPKQGETVHAKTIQYIPGGKGENQAVGCARLGADTRMLGAVGADPFGERILQDLKEYSIPTQHILCLESVPTGTATIFHTAEDNCIAIVVGANGEMTPEYVISTRI